MKLTGLLSIAALSLTTTSLASAQLRPADTVETNATRLGQVAPLAVLTHMPAATARTGPYNGINPELLKELGYVEDEYLVTGTGNIYRYGSDWTLQTGRTAVPFTSQFIVRKPADPRKFSGNVIVEVMHGGIPRGQFNAYYPYFAANGDAHVVILRSPEYFTEFSPTRYQSLNIVSEGQVWDIVSQVGRLLKTDGPGYPFDGFGKRYMVASGTSGNATMLLIFIGDGFHERWRMPGGGPIFDGFLPFIAHGSFTYQTVTPKARAPRQEGFVHPFLQIPFDDPRRKMQPHGVPIIQAVTEGEVEIPLDPPPLQDFGADWIYVQGLEPKVEKRLFYRRPDSNTTTDKFRLYELTGAGHGGFFGGVSAEVMARAVPTYIQPPDPAEDPAYPYPRYGPRKPVGHLPGAPFAMAMWDAMFRWVRTGTPPPSEPPIEVDASRQTVKRDANGNALGGLRLPQLDVPTARYTGTNPGAVLSGSEEPFSREKLRQLYGTCENYERLFHQRVDALSKRGWILPQHVATVKAQATAVRERF